MTFDIHLISSLYRSKIGQNDQIHLVPNVKKNWDTATVIYLTPDVIRSSTQDIFTTIRYLFAPR